MRKLKYIIAIGLIAMVGTMSVSCSKWLDLTPDAQVSSEDLFSTPKGYMDMLNGIYIIAASEKLYGEKLTFAFSDVLAQSYEFKSANHAFYELSKYNYKAKSVEESITAIWKELYFCIANCNILLNKLEEVDAKFFTSESHYNMIKGEALALRAFFHFELMRMFVPSFAAGGDEGIPYTTKFGKEIAPSSNKEEFIQKVIGDLTKARELLNGIDPVFEPIFKKPSDPWTAQMDIYMFTQPHPSKESFISYRGFRMNYYAVTAMLARVHTYHGNINNAFPFADEVIKSTNFYFVKSNEVMQDPEYRNRIMRSEIIFSFYVPKLTSNYFPYTVHSSNADKYVTCNNWESIFGSKTSGDLRLKYLMDMETLENLNQVFCTRFFKPNNSTAQTEGNYGNIAPVIRLSEMYYITAEYQIQTDLPKAQKALKDLRSARMVWDAITVSTPEEVRSFIVNDARREFMCEGQLFYLYKRLNMDVIDESGKSSFNKSYFVLPIPNIELEFGDRLSHLLK